jgi:hypothetical protein
MDELTFARLLRNWHDAEHKANRTTNDDWFKNDNAAQVAAHDLYHALHEEVTEE